MATDSTTVAEFLQSVSIDRLQQIAANGGVANAVLFFREGEVSAAAEVTWIDFEEKNLVLGACRTLALGLRADAVVMVVDTYLSQDPSVLPSENPAAREAVCSFGVLAAGTVIMAQLIYGRDDQGEIYFDADATKAVTESVSAVVDSDTPQVGGMLTDVFADAVVNTPGAAVDLEQIFAAAEVLGNCQAEVMVSEHVLA